MSEVVLSLLLTQILSKNSINASLQNIDNIFSPLVNAKRKEIRYSPHLLGLLSRTGKGV
jgi:hypothetical protein